jgi:LacI family transcriptional regulator
MRKGPRIRILDVAEASGVSASTVTAALNPNARGNTRVSPETVARVRAIAGRLGYLPNQAAQQLRGNSSGVVGVLLNANFSVVNYRRLSALERCAHARGIRLLVAQFDDEVSDVRAYLEDFEARNLEGVLALNHELPGDLNAIPSAFADTNLPVVYINTPIGCPGVAALEVDYGGAIMQAMRYLHGCGRRRISLVISDDFFVPGRKRLEGYRAAQKELRVDDGDDLLWVGNSNDSWTPAWPDLVPDFAIEDIVEKVVREHHADAILASNDRWAVRICKALRSQGIGVPSDVALIGFNNDDVSWACDPELTTIETDNCALAEDMLDLLFAVNAAPPGFIPPARVVLPQMIVREST